MKDVQFNAENISSNMDGERLFHGQDVDAPSVLLMLGIQTSFELLKVGVADAKT